MVDEDLVEGLDDEKGMNQIGGRVMMLLLLLLHQTQLEQPSGGPEPFFLVDEV